MADPTATISISPTGNVAGAVSRATLTVTNNNGDASTIIVAGIDPRMTPRGATRSGQPFTSRVTIADAASAVFYWDFMVLTGTSQGSTPTMRDYYTVDADIYIQMTPAVPGYWSGGTYTAEVPAVYTTIRATTAASFGDLSTIRTQFAGKLDFSKFEASPLHIFL